MKRRAEFVIKFTVDLDMFPGWGYSVIDWVNFAVDAVKKQTHHNTSYEVISTREWRE